MKRKHSATRRGIWPRLLLIGATSLASCSPAPVAPVTGYCPVAIHPDQATRLWLSQLNPPPGAVDYFHKIGMQQRTIEQNCGR